jgi:putative transposase
MLTELKNRGVQDIFIACVDGLNGFPEAIETVYPKTQVQLCVVHLLRNSLTYVGWKERKVVAGDLRKNYTASTREAAEQELKGFAAKWDEKYPSISALWRRNWERIVVFFAYLDEIRRVIYTTNAIESTNMSLRKIIRNRGSFPTDEAALKLIYLALENISRKWRAPIREWKAALNRFAIVFGDRLPYV